MEEHLFFQSRFSSEEQLMKKSHIIKHFFCFALLGLSGQWSKTDIQMGEEKNEKSITSQEEKKYECSSGKYGR